MPIGYCCICLGINNGRRKKDEISVNRGMVRRTFDSKGLKYVSELAELNLRDTLEVLKWNKANNIYVYRMSSDSFPWMSEYEFEQLPSWSKLNKQLVEIGNYVKSENMRVSYHPGPFTVLASENESVVKKSINELNKHAQLMDYMQLEQSTKYAINIHINTTKPTNQLAATRFCDNFALLNDSAKAHLTIENDDKLSQYSVRMLYDMVHKIIGIPVVFDQMHYRFGPKDQTMEEALKLAVSTWKEIPLTHMSSSRVIEDTKARATAHADYIYEKIETFGLEFDTEIEAKAKDQALIKYRNDFK